MSYAISEQGARHLKGSPLVEILDGANPLDYNGKAKLFKTNQSDVLVINVRVLCYFVKFGISLKEVFQMVNPCTGFNYKNPRELETVGKRITTTARLFNNHEGFNKKDDILPVLELKSRCFGSFWGITAFLAYGAYLLGVKFGQGFLKKRSVWKGPINRSFKFISALFAFSAAIMIIVL